MTAQFLQGGPTISIGQQSQGRDWVVLGSTRNVHSGGDLTTATSQTKVNNESTQLYIYPGVSF